AYHHVMNRGYDGNDIFFGHKNKNQFIDYLEDSTKKLKIRLFTYCVMDNHYHLVLENSNGRMSDCMMRLNGLYGMYYRKIAGGKGYVFQSRFKSTLIENESYLIQSILYSLQNPIRAGIVTRAEEYIWSSVNDYYSNRNADIVETEFVNNLLGKKEEFLRALHSMVNGDKLPINMTKYGELLGHEAFLKSALKKHDRRKKPTHQSKGIQRINERYFEPVEKVLMEFKTMNGLEIEEINTGTLKGKRYRGELLVQLKDRAGLKFREIGAFDIFSDLSFASLRSIYRNMKRSDRR
ncbi:MAG: transposase, partial [Candidatus Aminicenantes bacterium]|nr:transposase [Candidatus Aminicenantes bacterium]